MFLSAWRYDRLYPCGRLITICGMSPVLAEALIVGVAAGPVATAAAMAAGVTALVVAVLALVLALAEGDADAVVDAVAAGEAEVGEAVVDDDVEGDGVGVAAKAADGAPRDARASPSTSAIPLILLVFM